VDGQEPDKEKPNVAGLVAGQMYKAVRRSFDKRRSLDIAHVGLEDKGITSRNIPDVYPRKDGLKGGSRRTSEVIQEEGEKSLDEILS